MSRAPKKYVDAKRTHVTPEWAEWDKERRDAVAEDAPYAAMSLGFEPSVYFPEEEGKLIPEEGAWIIVVEEPFTELRSRFRIPPLSMWRARHHELNDGAFKYGSLSFWPQQAVIATPGGDLHLWAHEYIVAKDAMKLATDPDSTIHSLGGQPVIDDQQLFYLMSRGIPRHEAMMLLFNTIKSLDFVYVTFPEWITDALAGMGQSLRRHITLNPRERENAGASS